MDFGSLLSMKLRAMQLGLIKWLAEQWDEGDEAFHIGGKRLEFTARDTNLILGLSIGGVNVIPVLDERSTDQLHIQLKLGKGNSVLATEIHKNLVVGGDDLKRRQAFALYALSTVLCPTTMRKMEDVYLQHVLDIQRIRNFDWATHVVDTCKHSFSLYNTKRRKLIGGCTVLVQVQERIYDDVGQICGGPTWEVILRGEHDHTTSSCPTNINYADVNVQGSPHAQEVEIAPFDFDQLVKENKA